MDAAIFISILTTLFPIASCKDYPRLDKRIVNGYVDDRYNHPFLVQLRIYRITIDTYKWVDGKNCSGVFLRNHYALTAAKCFDHCSNDECNATLRVGSTLWDRGAPTIYADEIYIHDGYNPDTGNNNLAIVRAIKDITRGSPVVNSINFASQPIADGTGVTISGWGDACDIRMSYFYLRAVNLTVMNRDECVRRYLACSIPHLVVDETIICIEDNGKDSTAEGDSGAPVTVAATNQNVGSVLMGIVSLSPGCDYIGYPIVLTNVTSFKSWVDYLTLD